MMLMGDWLRFGGRWELVSVFQGLCLLTLVICEPFYQRRDHLDQSRYLQQHNDNVVKDRTDAEFVLSKYGYLRCQVGRKRREATARDERGGGRPSRTDTGRGGGPGTAGSSGSEMYPWGPNFEQLAEGCDEKEVAQAIKEYQRTYNLTPTGELDEETKLLMSTSRCGNKDNSDKSEGGTTAAATGATPTSTTTVLATAPSGVSIVISSPASSAQKNASDSVHIGSSSGDAAPSSSHRHHHHHSQNSNKKDEGRVNKSDQVGASQRLWKRAVNRIRADDPSQLLRVLKGAADSRRQSGSEARHRRHLQDYIKRLQQQDPTPLLEPWSDDERRRSRRSIIQVTANGGGGVDPAVGNGDPMVNMLEVREQHHTGVEAEQQEGSNMPENEMSKKEIIRWRLLTTGYSTRIPVEDQRATVDLAFRMWSEVIPLRFVEDVDSDINEVDIEVAFGRGSHQNCEHDFDGNGGEIAHSQQTGNMHFDDEENFKSIRSYTPDGIYLLRVAVHEIGHVLGLAHTNKSQSIMYAIYHGRDLSPEFELSRDDRTDIQKIYGVCKGKFSTVFDWVRKRPDNQFIYNTYFFRQNHYWMYENHANRTRYGDPLYIAREWDRVPDHCDGYLHTWYFTGTDIVDEAFFFRREYYYKYDSEHDRVFEGWPRRIRDDFGPKPGQTDGVPDNIDTVFFDMRDRNIYFFKDEWVYVVDPKEPEGSRGCCVRKRLITEEFPVAVEGDLPLPGNLDAVYYSYGDKMQYFIKDENLWRNRLFDPRQRRVYNGVQYLGKWYDRWMDICDVQAH